LGKTKKREHGCAKKKKIKKGRVLSACQQTNVFEKSKKYYKKQQKKE
jgi:hypothetical protein